MDILLNTIIATYFSTSRCLNLLHDPLNPLYIRQNISKTVATDLNETSIYFNFLGCHDFVVYTNKPVTAFRHLEYQIKVHPDRFNHRKYVFAKPASHPQEEDVFDVFSTSEISYVSDLIIAVSDKVGIGVWTHRYGGLEDHDKVYLLDTWFFANQTFKANNNLFPNKLKNQMGRTLRTAVFSYEPYAILEELQEGGYKYRGSEMRLMKTVAECLNMTLMPVINEEDYWGAVYENWSGNGLMGNLVEDNADIGGAALYRWELPARFLDLSTITVRSGITCLVPAPQLAAAWLTPIHVYSPQTWIAVVSAFVLSLLTTYHVRVLEMSLGTGISRTSKLKILGKALISTAKPFIMQPVTTKEISKSMLGKYLTGLVFMTALILATSYDSGLATIMTIPRYEEPVNTLQDFLGKNLQWGGTSDGWILSIEDASEPTLRELVSRFQAIPNETTLEKLSLTGSYAFAVERLLHDDYAIGNYIKQEVIQNYHLMTNDFYFELCVLMLRKSSILLPLVDKIILQSFDAGLILFWQNEAATQYMDQRVQKALKYHQKTHEIVKLKIVHVQGAFAVLMFGHSMALLVFLAEVLDHKLFSA